MYNIGDKIVHPLHGAGTIDEITTRNIDGTELEYYILELPTKNMTLMVPTSTCEKAGIRSLVTKEQAEEILSLIAVTDADDIANWNKRYRENSARIKSGEHVEVIKVIKSLTKRDLKQSLSTAERKMLHSAKQILVSELSLALDIPYKELESRIDSSISDSLK